MLQPPKPPTTTPPTPAPVYERASERAALGCPPGKRTEYDAGGARSCVRGYTRREGGGRTPTHTYVGPPSKPTPPLTLSFSDAASSSSSSPSLSLSSSFVPSLSPSLSRDRDWQQPELELEEERATADSQALVGS